MTVVAKSNGAFSVKAYRGDAKTLLAFNFQDKKSAGRLAGFTVACAPAGQKPYYIHNTLRFKTPSDHAQDAKESPNASINAPIHKFRWVHVPGQVHQGVKPFLGDYTYTVTPRHFDDGGSLLPLDAAKSVALQIAVNNFSKDRLTLGFTRGYVQSQAFGNHFGPKAVIRPKGKELIYDTAQQAGVAHGEAFSFRDEYEWLGFTARERIFAILEDVLGDHGSRLDVFAYDLNEPDVCAALLKLAGQGRVRVILDNASLHHASPPKPEDQFEKLFRTAATGDAAIKRGRFGNYAHDKVFLVSRGGDAVKVLTGSTNFSVTGLYVNSNHVLVFDDSDVAKVYAGVFEQAWNDDVAAGPFKASQWSAESFPFSPPAAPDMSITFAPHATPVALDNLNAIAARIAREGNKKNGSVLFAVMQMTPGGGPVLPALMALHKKQDIFSYGISDAPGGTSLYPVGQKTGVLVTGKPGPTTLPPPFNQVPGIGSGHQVHHKFVVCNFNGDEPVVYCGSSNLAQGGEEKNGDNLLAIADGDVATVFAIEALTLIDHFDFLNKAASGQSAPAKKKKAKSSQSEIAAETGWFLSTSNKWMDKYFDAKDLHFTDRQLFG